MVYLFWGEGRLWVVEVFISLVLLLALVMFTACLLLCSLMVVWSCMDCGFDGFMVFFSVFLMWS